MYPPKETLLEALKPHLSYPAGKCPWKSTIPDPFTGRLWAWLPFKLADQSGRIILWYLPGLLTDARQQDMLDALRTLGTVLARGKSNPDPSSTSRSTKEWRRNGVLFNPDVPAHGVPSGGMSVSAGWYHKPQDVCSYLPKAAVLLERNPSVADWARSSAETFALMSGILALVHPTQYEEGLRCMRKLARESLTPDIVGDWECVFTAISVMVNRETIFHREGQGHYEWYNILATYGSYLCGQLSFPGIGIDLDSRPGTVVAFCGNILRHGAPRCIGERVCLAYDMREAVHRWAATGPAQWSRGPNPT
ncbi:hypothetical protein CONPUDRAFT_45366 [Coniophora puteana RWD-64-598 SS2]|uniref:2OGFeDO JBP1/TET oxygenase domain-containing protein n=1 Tax=Coniophora puteana (strain RWD-64-598) TaxID=741705 RepID=A0A5M3N7E8_CONPW|nr:uncharacterized protein CONPUDRAFT_45366 [Coniophora puteana RWD-64-598 SS2]EIW87369.1 hypothetical protein CONPUDRAFT_45366 [Coniophora puteana RWD-64-598 SS2]